MMRICHIVKSIKKKKYAKFLISSCVGFVPPGLLLAEVVEERLACVAQEVVVLCVELAQVLDVLLHGLRVGADVLKKTSADEGRVDSTSLRGSHTLEACNVVDQL